MGLGFRVGVYLTPALLYEGWLYSLEASGLLGLEFKTQPKKSGKKSSGTHTHTETQRRGAQKLRKQPQSRGFRAVALVRSCRET